MKEKSLDKFNYKCDVLVTGAGPAGACLGLFLSSSGLDVIIADRKSKIEQPVRCAEYIPANMASLFDFKLKGLKNRINTMETFILPSLAKAGINTGIPMPLNVPDSVLKAPGYLIDRKIMIRDWIERFLKNGGRYLGCTRVIDICDGNLTALSKNNKITIMAKIIAGADGPLSFTGQKIGSRNTHFLTGINCRYENIHAGQKSTKIFFIPEIRGGYAWIFPGGDYLNAGFGADLSLYTDRCKKEAVMKETFKWFGYLLKNAFVSEGIIKNAENIQDIKRTAISGLIPVSGMVKEPAVGNIVLIGDAAGLCNPVTGAGIYSAVLSAKIASVYIKQAVSNADLEILKSLKASYVHHFGMSLDRALAKRKMTGKSWNSCRNIHDFKRLVRRTWI